MSSNDPLVYITDVWLSDIEGVALWVGSPNPDAEYILTNINVDGADIGVLCDGGPVRLIDSHIRADEPLSVAEDGEIRLENTRIGSNADPSPPDNVPRSAREAAER